VDKGVLKSNCDKLHPLLYSLLRWLLASNRCHLKKLKNHEQIKAMNTPHQYILLSSTPEKEQVFQELKKKYGSVLAFHGSNLCNWYRVFYKMLTFVKAFDYENWFKEYE